MSLVDEEINLISDDEEDSGTSDAMDTKCPLHHTKCPLHHWSHRILIRLSSLDSLIKIQKKVVHVITFSLYTESSKPLFQKLEILNVKQLNNRQTVLFMVYFE